MKVRYFRRVLASELDRYDFTTAYLHWVPSLAEPVALIELETDDDQQAALAAIERRYVTQ